MKILLITAVYFIISFLITELSLKVSTLFKLCSLPAFIYIRLMPAALSSPKQGYFHLLH